MEIKDLCILASFHSLASGKVFHTLNCDLLQDGESLCCSLPNQKISSCVLSTDNSNREAEEKKKKKARRHNGNAPTRSHAQTPA